MLTSSSASEALRRRLGRRRLLGGDDNNCEYGGHKAYEGTCSGFRAENASRVGGFANRVHHRFTSWGRSQPHRLPSGAF